MDSRLLFALTLVSVSAVLAFSTIVVAQEGPPEPSITGWADVEAIINRVINWLFAILMAVAVILILMAAFEFLTARGSEEQVNRARQMLTYAVVGVGVALLSRAVVPIVRLILGVGT